MSDQATAMHAGLEQTAVVMAELNEAKIEIARLEEEIAILKDARISKLVEAWKYLPPALQDFYYACMRTFRAKGADYTRGKSVKAADHLDNFREGAKRTEAISKLPIEQGMKVVWSVYAFKHESSIERWLAEGKVESEPVWKRIMDSVVYRSLLVLMAMEHGEEGPIEMEKLDVRKDS